jgi:hypothetical protein
MNIAFSFFISVLISNISRYHKIKKKTPINPKISYANRLKKIKEEEEDEKKKSSE